jgi:hypothetical protein
VAVFGTWFGKTKWEKRKEETSSLSSQATDISSLVETFIKQADESTANTYKLNTLIIEMQSDNFRGLQKDKLKDEAIKVHLMNCKHGAEDLIKTIEKINKIYEIKT